MFYKWSGRGSSGTGRDESGKIWADSKDEAIALLRAEKIVIKTIDRQPVPAGYTVSREAEAAAAKREHATPLHKACEDKDIARVEQLIADGADLEARNIRGETPLDIAVGYENAEIVRLLVAAGANIHAESPAGGTIRDYAGRLSGGKEIVKILDDESTPADDITEEESDAAPTTPARPERPRGPKKPWWDVYTSMLALTLLAILFGCVFLLMEWSRYNFETTPTSTPAASAPGPGS